MLRHYCVILRELVINTSPIYTFQMQLLVTQFTIKMFHIGFIHVLILYSLKFQYYKIFKTLILSYLQQNGLKSFCCYISHEVSLCGGRIYNLINTDCMLTLLSLWDSFRMGKDIPKRRIFPTILGRVTTQKKSCNVSFIVVKALDHKMKVLFLFNVTTFPEKALIFGRFPSFRVCPSDKNSMKMSMEQRWNDKDTAKSKYSQQHLTQRHSFVKNLTGSGPEQEPRAFATTGRRLTA